MTNASLPAVAGTRYLLLSLSQTCRNTTTGSAGKLLASITVGGVVVDFEAKLVPNVDNVVNVSHVLPAGGILCDVNTPISFSFDGLPTTARTIISYREVIE